MSYNLNIFVAQPCMKDHNEKETVEQESGLANAAACGYDAATIEKLKKIRRAKKLFNRRLASRYEVLRPEQPFEKYLAYLE